MYSESVYTLLQNQNLFNTFLWKKSFKVQIFIFTVHLRWKKKKSNIVSRCINTLALSHRIALTRQHNVSSTAEFLKANLGIESHSFLQTFPYY